jgi:endonuclease/exonuclease/phosphatase family metal-dependent hydrolase
MLFTAMLLVLPYLFLAASVAGFVLWSIFPDRASLGLVTVSPLLFMLMVWGATWPSDGLVNPEGETVRLMTYNVRRLWGDPLNEAPAAGCVGEVIEESEPDVVALLEVSEENVAELSQRYGLTCHHASYRKSEASHVGGLAVCTRGTRWRLSSGSGNKYLDDMDWFYLSSEVERNGRTLNVLAVHLYPYTVSRYAGRSGRSIFDLGRDSVDVVRAQGAQSAALLERVSRFNDPTILAGDFNSTRDFAMHSALRGHLTDTFEQGGFGFGGTVDLFDWLPLRVDFIYASDELGTVESKVINSNCSDHRPVVTELVLRD